MFLLEVQLVQGMTLSSIQIDKLEGKIQALAHRIINARDALFEGRVEDAKSELLGAAYDVNEDFKPGDDVWDYLEGLQVKHLKRGPKSSKQKNNNDLFWSDSFGV